MSQLGQLVHDGRQVPLRQIRFFDLDFSQVALYTS